MAKTLDFVPLSSREPVLARLIAGSRHWSEADEKTHEQMGFHTGWGICADQLEEVAAVL